MHNRLLESIFSFSNQGMLLLGVDAARPCYQVLSVNAVAQQLLGQYLPRTDLLQDERLVACLNQCWQQQVSIQDCYRHLCFSFIPLPEDSGRTTTGFILGLLDRDTSRSPIYENPARLNQLLDQLLGFIFSCESTPPWQLTYLSQGCFAVTGYTPADFLSRGDQGLDQITYPQDLPQVLATIEQAIAHASPYEIEYRIHHRDGHLRWVREQGIPVLDSLGRVIAIDGAIADDITLWKELEYALEQPIAGLNQWVGSDFVCHLAQFLSQQLGVDHVLIGEISGPNNDWLTTVAYCCHGELHPPLSYALVDTPCANVLHADTCFYSQGVARLFPKDKMLATAGVDAYIGIPLRNSLGETLGLVAIMHSQPLERVAYIEGLLKIFGVRLTAELERIRAERALKAHKAHLEQQLRYEKLISTVASEFINLPLANIPEGIHKVLRLLGEITAADRSYLFERDTPTLRSFSNTYEWCAADIEPQQDTLQGVASTDFPLFFQQLYTQGHVLWPHVRGLPLNLPDRAGLDAQGIQSLIVVALRRGSETIGFLGLDFVRQARQDLETLLPLMEVMAATFTNVLERQETERSLRAAESKYRSIFENAVEGMFQSTPEGRYLAVNPALARMYGYESPAQLQAELTDIAHQLYVDARRRDEFVQALVKNGIVTDFESQVYRRDGQIIWISENARAVYDDDGCLAYFEGTVVDITERKLAESTIHYQAFHDLLTGLPNRALFDDLLPLALAESRRSQQRVGVMFLDLDRFKVINDTLGHAIGDQLLQQVAERLVHCLRETDTIARWGGDEFTILLPMIHHSDDLAIVAERILHALKPEFILDGHHLHITTSIGIAVYPDHGESPDLLLRNADTALYRAKETGRNTYQFYTDSFNSAAHALLRLENDLHTALSLEELCLYYQPQLDLKRRQIHHIEALVRWQHPTQGLLGPRRFINVAEENGLILPIGDWALRRACHDCQAWQRQGLAGVGVAVNLSSRQFLHPNLLEEIQQSLAASQLPPHLLTLEITESTAIHNVNLTQEILSHLRALGVGIILDDFGTGYASLTYLKHFPITGLKIDRSFVEDIVSDRRDQAITKAIIDLAKGLGLPIVAEGVETVAQLEQLTALGCDVIQGFIFARPMPYAELLEWVQTAPPRIEC
ncbi:bifunctional diguanylate cyclase/phosphodiesterase [Parathermosynechococcus lividus]